MTTLTRRTLLTAAAAAPVAALPTSPASAHSGEHADLIIYNGRIRTMDAADRTVQALAVTGGRVTATGSDRDLRALCGPRTQILDARRATVLPGINDAHNHLSALGLTYLAVDVDTATVAELVARVADAAGRTADGAWIRGGGWSELRLPRPPTRHDLDPVTGNRPTILTDFTLHASVANSAALRLAGITADTTPPAGAVIERDPDGTPTGVLREGAQALVQAVVPAWTAAEQATAITTAAAQMLAHGVTSITDPGITAAVAAAYDELTTTGSLPLRVTALLHAGDSPATMRQTLDLLRARGSLRDPRVFHVSGVKVFSDGVPTQARTAYLHWPYDDGTRGALTIAGADSREQHDNLVRMIALAHRAGAQIGTHACGDAAVDAIVGAYVAALRDRSGRDRRHYLIHGDLATPASLRTMAAHDIGITMNAEIKYMIGRVLEPVLGAARTDYHWPYRTALHAGARVASGSDAPVTNPNWLKGLASMVARIDASGQVSGLGQRITLTQALRTYTSTPAWQDHAERWKGTLRPGMTGDLCILDTDLAALSPGEYPRASVRATVVGGRVAHHHDAARPAAAGRADRTRLYQDGRCCCDLAAAIRAAT